VDPLELLACADVQVLGRMPWSSNATYLVELCLEGQQSRAVYKPRRGERPLWDFPHGLYRREVAAYLLSEALGWSLVPPTVVREDAPLGEGSLQLFVEADFEQHYFSLHEARPDLHPQLRRICAFDLVANNTDRKSGHVLLGPDDHLWAIDNALCFSADFKLRTVIWEFGGEAVPEPLLADLRRLAGDPPAGLAALLDDDEIEAVRARAESVLERERFPIDTTGRRYPWPLV
jgi:uncharacterized repeat protein (TIGR03843 family)